MKSSPKKIIRGADVEGIIFCSPSGELEAKTSHESQKESDLRALEEFWYNKGLKEGQEKGFEKGLEEGKTTGHQSGLKQGKQEGMIAGREEGKNTSKEEAQENAQNAFKDVTEQLQKIVLEIQSKKKQFLDEGMTELVKLCLNISEKILFQELSDRDKLTHLIERLLIQAKSISHNEVTTIKLSEDDFAILEERFEHIKYQKNEAQSLDFISDSKLSNGCFKIETSKGLLNFDIKRQLDVLEHEIIQASHD